MDTDLASDRRRWIVWRSLSILIHVVGASIYLFSLIYEDVVLPPRQDPSLRNVSSGRLFAGRWKYLTHWDFVLQTITFLICLLYDVAQLVSKRQRRSWFAAPTTDQLSSASMEEEQPGYSSKKRISAMERFRIIRDTICQSLAFPMGIIVMLLFWGLHTIDKNLVLPKTGRRSPSWLNHVQHTLVGVLIVVEVLVTHHQRPDWQYSVLLLSMIIVAYCLWIHYIGFVQRYWVYPILEKLIWWQRIFFILGCIGALMFISWLGSLVYRYWWTRPRRLFFDKGIKNLPTLIRLQDKKLALS